VGSLNDIPNGEYLVQAFVNVYTKFERPWTKVGRPNQRTPDGYPAPQNPAGNQVCFSP
jgi:hypothetical protein